MLFVSVRSVAAIIVSVCLFASFAVADPFWRLPEGGAEVEELATPTPTPPPNPQQCTLPEQTYRCRPDPNNELFCDCCASDKMECYYDKTLTRYICHCADSCEITDFRCPKHSARRCLTFASTLSLGDAMLNPTEQTRNRARNVSQVDQVVERYNRLNSDGTPRTVSDSGRRYYIHHGHRNYPNFCVQDSGRTVCGCTRVVGRGCFPPGTFITLADGSKKKVEQLRAGDLLWNPITGAATAIKQILEGPEYEPLIEFGYGDVRLKVSSKHPVVTDRGTIPAADLALGDLVIGADGEFHSVTALSELEPEFGQRVINFTLDTESPYIEDHLVLSDGIVTGDFDVQSGQVYRSYLGFGG